MITSYLVERLKRFQVENLTVRDFTTFKKHIVLFFVLFLVQQLRGEVVD